MKGKKKNKIVFVCTGNTCRSPMAEALFRKEIESLPVHGLFVCSAGIKADVGGALNANSKQVLKEEGFEDFVFHPTQINEDLIHESIAIVCMTESQREWIMDFRWNVLRASGVKKIENNVYSFKELVGYEILDPFGKDITCYRYVFQLLLGGMPILKERILTPKIREKFSNAPKQLKAANRPKQRKKEQLPKKQSEPKPKRTGEKKSTRKKSETIA
jgi:protein-tyrosine phosphatase